MKSMSTFQLIVTAVFVVLTLVGVGVFAAFGGLLGNTSVGTVVIWGASDSQAINGALQALKEAGDKTFQDVSYMQKDASTYESELINAIAAGRGPDLFFLTQEELGALADKVSLVPYSAVSQSSYLNGYVDEGRVFLTGQGAWALPVMIDPLVMYYNRDLLASAGVAQAPTTWNDFLTLAPKLTSLDASKNVQTSAVALGTWDNIAHAKAVLSTLFMQAGDSIVGVGAQGYLTSVFGATSPGAAENPAASALRFYTEFANPGKTDYSWNSGLPLDRNAFAAGDLGAYFGYASEYGAIAARNPNLHFSVAVMPQLSQTAQLTYGLITGVAVSRAAANPQGALAVAEKLAGPSGAAAVAAAAGLPPVRRDTPVDTSASDAAQVFAQSALISRGWFDPDQGATDDIFKTMIESVTSGRSDPSQAVSDAARDMQDLFQQQ